MKFIFFNDENIDVIMINCYLNIIKFFKNLRNKFINVCIDKCF